MPAALFWIVTHPKESIEIGLLTESLLEKVPATINIKENGVANVIKNGYPKDWDPPCPPEGNKRVVYQELYDYDQFDVEKTWHVNSNWSDIYKTYKVSEDTTTTYQRFVFYREYRKVEHRCVCNALYHKYEWKLVKSENIDWVTKQEDRWERKGTVTYNLDLGLPPIMWD